jgi:hypothetical protein
MRKSTKIDFFSFSLDGPDLEPILRRLHSLPINSPKRTTQPTDDWVRLARGKLKEGGVGYFGDMMRISMSPPGFRANPEGQIAPIVFNIDEGVAECSAFYYDFESRILVLQRNSRAVSITQFAHFIKEVEELSDELEFRPVLRPTSLSKVMTLNQIRKIHISANVIEVMPTIEDIDANTKNVILNAMQTESSSIELILKAGREKEATLNRAVVMETLESWLKIHGNYSDDENEIVRKIEVCGVDETGDRIEFDMLKDKIFTRMDFEWVPNDEALWENRLQKIQQGWDLNHVNLKRNLEESKKSQ